MCDICCEKYNKTSRAKVSCPYCEFDACRSCCETYILNESVPKCMKPDCDKEWSRGFMKKNFTNTFLTSKYKKHVEDVLFDKEKALLPATQYLVEEKIAKNALRRELADVNALIARLMEKKRELEYQINHGVVVQPEKTRFVRKCPANNCRGFLSTQWKCGICEQWTCPDCHELKGPDRDCTHTCDPNNVETAKLLAKDTKPCPKCSCMIFKIDGCDQMWCTQCHTAFSWKTGKLESNIHNPHYYEWRRRNGNTQRNHGDFECGRDITHNTVMRIQTLSQKHSDLAKIVTKKSVYGDRNYVHYNERIMNVCAMIQNMIHNHAVELPMFQQDYLVKNQELRVKYLENEITEEEFKMRIQRNDKKHKKNTEIAQVLQLAEISFTDIIYRLMDDLDKSANRMHQVDAFLGELNELNAYCNELFKDIASTYDSIEHVFKSKFVFAKVVVAKKTPKTQKKNAAVAAEEVIIDA